MTPGDVLHRDECAMLQEGIVTVEKLEGAASVRGKVLRR